MKKAIQLIIAIICAIFLGQIPILAQDTLYVDAGGFNLRMVKKGNETGPTILMEHGKDKTLS
ncbi:MAG TPA: hypothetical protein PKE63_01005 [Lacibacter sp.]|nr:hypothetical protein [Lacibacter sp.]HMO89956.1 hypothetical protein [Lacibacter sp.]HMP85819.1 hypothetical protein [Lacibacter sp.]